MLTAESGRFDTGLRFSTPTHRALNLVYVLSTRNLDEEKKLEFDGWVTASAEDVAEWQEEQKAERLRLIGEIGEMG